MGPSWHDGDNVTRPHAHTSRRGFLAAIGISAAGLVALGSSTPASASSLLGQWTKLAKGKFVARNQAKYRRATLRRGTTLMTPGATLTVLAHRRVIGPDGTLMLDRNAFDAVLKQTRGKPLGSGTYTFTTDRNITLPLHISRTADNRYSALVMRYTEA